MKKTILIFSLLFLCFNALIAENLSDKQPKTELIDIKIDNSGPDIKLKYTYNDDGIYVLDASNLPDSTNIHYLAYNEISETKAVGKLEKGKPIYFPYKTNICIWLDYGNSKISKAYNLTLIQKQDLPLMNILSPKPGVWKSPQVLYINSDPSTEIFYSIDGADPAKSGLAYTEPFLIEKTGNIRLRIKAVSKNGEVAEEIIEYRVSRKGKKFEHAIVSNYMNSQIKNLKPLGSKVPYKILDWNFVEFNSKDPIYYEISSSPNPPSSFYSIKRKYTQPFFVNRKSDLYIFWAYENSEINTLKLPAKPILQGLENKYELNHDVKLTFTDDQFQYFFETSELFYPREPSFNSSQFDTNTKTFSIDENTEQVFNVRIKAFYNNVPHGEFFTKFKIDKIKPPKPDLKYSTESSLSNSPVKIILPEQNNDYKLNIDISPKAVEKNNNTLILTGSNTGKVDYIIKAYNQDTAGNISEILERHFTIGLYSIYVDSKTNKTKSDGSKEKPFSNIHDAVEYIQDFAGKNKNPTELPVWTINISGNFKVEEPILITNNIKLTSNDSAQFTMDTNVGFVVENSVFKIENCSISRSEYDLEPREVPIIYASNSDISIKQSNIEVINGGSVINLFNSHIESIDSNIKSTQKNSCTIFNLSNSTSVITNTDIYGKGNSVVAISAVNSTITMNNVICNLLPECVSRAVEAWASNITIGRFSCTRQPENSFNFDSCIWYDKKSKVNFTNKPVIKGFKYDITKQ